MLDFSEVKLKTIVIHTVGNSLQEEGMKLSKKPLEFKEDIVKELLQKYFLSSFKGQVLYNFFHETDLAMNELFTLCSQIFANPDSFFLQTINIAKHLYEKSNHHNIKGGEFYLVYFEDCILNGDVTDVIGLFKSENKDTFLKVFQDEEELEVEFDQGININKLDKGCLVFNAAADKGYKLCIVDNTNKSQEAQYWKNDFLKIKQHEDSFFHTQNVMHMCKNFCAEVLTKEHEVPKADQIEILNRSMDYFTNKETFNIKEFEEEVMAQPELIDAFSNYKDTYAQKFEIPTYNEFDISQGAVQSNKKIFKNIIKLDKNFHIYIHGNREWVERGFDEVTGMNYYKLFFNNEK
jgi:hypothetical protein